MLDQRDKAAIEGLLDGHLGLNDVIMGLRDAYREKMRTTTDDFMKRIYEVRYEHLARFLNSFV